LERLSAQFINPLIRHRLYFDKTGIAENAEMLGSLRLA
jgi:hypothetical protein